jgi:arginase family enzyme
MELGLADSLTQVGIRAQTGHQRQQADRFGVETIDMRAWARGARPVLHGPLYVSIDLDALDPAFAPGVSHPEPGGLSVRELLDLVQSLPGPIAGADIVELNPTLDPMGLTARVAAKLVRELAVASWNCMPGCPRKNPACSLRPTGSKPWESAHVRRDSSPPPGRRRRRSGPGAAVLA